LRDRLPIQMEASCRIAHQASQGGNRCPGGNICRSRSSPERGALSDVQEPHGSYLLILIQVELLASGLRLNHEGQPPIPQPAPSSLQTGRSLRHRCARFLLAGEVAKTWRTIGIAHHARNAWTAFCGTETFNGDHTEATSLGQLSRLSRQDLPRHRAPILYQASDDERSLRGGHAGRQTPRDKGNIRRHDVYPPARPARSVTVCRPAPLWNRSSRNTFSVSSDNSHLLVRPRKRNRQPRAGS